MKLQELAEEIQSELEQSNIDLIIFQEGRQWKYEPYGLDDEAEKRFLTIRHRIDDKAVIVNGKRDFDSYDIKYIQNQIKRLRK